LDPQGGETVDFKVMIHKIHAGGALASIPGADGIVWDNPATAGDESADNGEYAIWGYRNTKHEWWKAEFPAVIENCTKCHQGAGANVDNWKAKPSREVCGSCHDDVNFATGANHGGGAQLTDNNCAVCHPAAGAISAPLSYPVPAAHEWMKKDPRHIPEFDVGLGVSAPANGQYFVDGEAPYVKIVLSKDGVPIDHTTVVEDNDGAEGCLTDPCPTGDGKFTVFSLFVHGPRARRVPVLTTLARAKVVSPTTGPWDLSATGAGLSLKVDSGKDVVVYDVSGGDKLASGTINVTVASGTVAGSCGTGVACIANATAVTAQEIVNWLNANAAFKARAIAYLDADRPAIRSRNLGVFYAVQLQTSAVATSVFANDLTVHPIGGSTVGNNLTQRTNPANNDPKVSRAVDALRYTLDPVDDLQPGTYVATVEIADGGRVSNTNYRTPSVAKVTFQVGTATAEAAPAGNCDQCHQGPEGTGFILDFMRHYKIFDDTAVDQCGSCHDYQSSVATGNWGGARPISKRVHAVHFGSSLVYPLLTVDYSNGDPIAGRNWDITFPQDVRNCETCHSSSSTWMTKPARLPCAGCHDSDAAKGHMTVMTADPTPADPWSGDETESCQACH
jgi:predicted CXXCH cytochrome family protein